ncbi:MAG TPA: enoyl-CoA hydratase/isomerase family protein [Gemmatimonadales bacterium]
MSAVLLAARDAGILTLTLNRPDKRNALSAALIAALASAVREAELDAAVRVVLLRGAGRDFCAGADLAELLVSADRSPEENEAEALRLGEVFLAFRALPKPVVAAVQGNALAGGCGLATACDLVLAGPDARFGYPEIQRGFVPAMVLTLLRRAVGEKLAFDLVATGRLLSAEEACAAGLVSRVLPGETFDREVASVAGALAYTSASALGLTKKLLYELDGLGMTAGIRLGARVNALARSTPEFRELVERFLRR